MKKTFLISILFLINIILFYYVQGEEILYFSIKYGFPNMAIRIVFNVTISVINLIYMYLSIYQYEYVKENIIIRLGKKKYKKKIVSIYLLSLSTFIICNLLIDYLIIRNINIPYIIINTVLLLFPLIYLKKRQCVNDYFLFYSIMFITLVKILIFH